VSITPVKACENAGMVGTKLYTWNNCEQKKGTLVEEGIFGLCQRRDHREKE